MKDIEIPISLAFLVISFSYAITLLFFFFGKRRVKTKQNKIFGIMLIINIISIIMEVFCIYSMDMFGDNYNMIFLINRLFLICIVWAMIFIALYVTNLVDLSEGLAVKTKKQYKSL